MTYRMPIFQSRPVKCLRSLREKLNLQKTRLTKSDGYFLALLLLVLAASTAVLNVASASGAPTLNLNWRQLESENSEKRDLCMSSLTHQYFEPCLQIDSAPLDGPYKIRYTWNRISLVNNEYKGRDSPTKHRPSSRSYLRVHRKQLGFCLALINPLLEVCFHFLDLQKKHQNDGHRYKNPIPQARNRST